MLSSRYVSLALRYLPGGIIVCHLKTLYIREETVAVSNTAQATIQAGMHAEHAVALNPNAK